MAEQKKMVEAITAMDVDFAKWYTDVIKKAEMIDYSSVKGCMVIRPYGYAIRENIQRILDGMFKATGHEILSTHNGYIVQKSPHVERILKLQHTKELTEDELLTIINYGGTVVDVFVWHKVYGKVSAKLNIYAKYQVDKYIENVRTGKSTELMDITGGYHYHTVRADSEKTLDLIEEKLQEKGFIILQEKQ